MSDLFPDPKLLGQPGGGLARALSWGRIPGPVPSDMLGLLDLIGGDRRRGSSNASPTQPDLPSNSLLRLLLMPPYPSPPPHQVPPLWPPGLPLAVMNSLLNSPSYGEGDRLPDARAPNDAYSEFNENTEDRTNQLLDAIARRLSNQQDI